jgi:predicted Rossmann fold nucleotide-binding protein DprA/Smf involved in DNA uptake
VLVLAGSAGCDALAASGAEAASNPDELLRYLLDGAAPAPHIGDATAPSTRPLFPKLPDDPRARRLYEALDGTPRDLGELADRAGLGAGETMALAIDLEIGGLAARAAGGRYLRLG